MIFKIIPFLKLDFGWIAIAAKGEFFNEGKNDQCCYYSGTVCKDIAKCCKTIWQERLNEFY